MMQRKYPTARYWQPGGMEVTFCNEPGEGLGSEGASSLPLQRYVHMYVCTYLRTQEVDCLHVHVSSMNSVYVCVV